MAVHYNRELLQEAKRTGLAFGTIAVGKTNVWQGLLATDQQVMLLQLLDVQHQTDKARDKAEREEAARHAATLTIPGMEDLQAKAAALVSTAVPNAEQGPAAKARRGRPRKKAAGK